MTTQHTPGPWQVTEALNNDYPLRRMRSLNCRSMVLAHINENYDGEANARLIAAAPDLLAALREIAETVDHNSKIVIRLRQIAFAAIARVEGK